MRKTAITFGAILVVLAIALLGFNRLVGLSEAVEAAWADVQNAYQRRADLIPNLVKTVQGAADFEKSTLESVVEARASVGQTTVAGGAPESAEQLAAFERAQGALSSALSRLLVVVERYPELKANQNFVALQTQLEGTENRITVERKRFNETTQSYNRAIKTFPGVLIAAIAGFETKPYFQATAGAETAPDVQFDFRDR